MQHYQSNLFHGVLVIELLAKHRVEHESIIDGRLELHFWHVEESAHGLFRDLCRLIHFTTLWLQLVAVSILAPSPLATWLLATWLLSCNLAQRNSHIGRQVALHR